MKIELSFVELHTPLFLAGTNLQNKLDVTKRPIKLTYDRHNQELIVVFNGKAAIIPFPSVASMEPIDAEAAGIDTEIQVYRIPKADLPKNGKPIKAQVSHPHDVVQGRK